MNRDEMERVATQIVDAAVKVHSRLGPGVFESAYEACLAHELRGRGLSVLTQVDVPIVYDGARIDLGYRLDLLVNDEVIIELKAVARLLPIHEAQLLSYLKLSDRRLGFLINFHVPRLADGLRRMVHRL